MSVERLDHLGIVAGICREIELADYLDTLAGPSQQQVSMGTAMVAMIPRRCLPGWPRQARQRFGIAARQVQVDTTSLR